MQTEVKEFEEKIIALDRVTRVVKGGRRFRFRATVVVGDGKGQVGVGVGKGGDVQSSIAKAVAVAKKNLITVQLRKRSINHEITTRYGGAIVMLKPASAGTGVIAGGAVRPVVEAAGIADILTKSLGSSNKINNAYATIKALAAIQKDDLKKPANEKIVKSKDEQSVVKKVTKPAAKKDDKK